MKKDVFICTACHQVRHWDFKTNEMELFVQASSTMSWLRLRPLESEEHRRVLRQALKTTPDHLNSKHASQ